MRRFEAGYPRGVTVPVLASAPTEAGQGLAMSAFTIGAGYPDRYQLRVDVSSSAATAVLWGRDASGTWGICGDTGNLGVVGGQQLPVGVYVFPAFLAGYSEVLLVKSGGTVAAALTPIDEF